jgi:hypothetical protein
MLLKMLLPEAPPLVSSPIKVAMQVKPPVLRCKPLQRFSPEPLFLPDDWKDVARSFNNVNHCLLAQSWLPQPEAGFLPTKVSVGWDSEQLWIYAELSDEEIFNSADGLNQSTWETGDVFEIFLRPAGSETYFEFHVTPENHLLQLRWPNAQAVLNLSPKETDEVRLSPYFLKPRKFQSWTHVNHEQRRWRVLAALDWKLLERKPEVGEKWFFSFSRYDVSRKKSTTVLSSTSPHKILDFHRQQEWGTLTFEATP